jgi:hypothetical protein
MLLDQLALTHLQLARLHSAAEQATQLEFKKLYLSTAARLQAEFCRTTLTLKAYRSPAGRSSSPAQSAAAPPSPGPAEEGNQAPSQGK